MNKRQAAKHARWLASLWIDTNLGSADTVHCSCGSPVTDADCPDCLRIEAALAALGQQLFNSGERSRRVE